MPAGGYPCGKCLGCRAEQAKEWSLRAWHEYQYHDNATWVTLTYDELHVPYVGNIDEGEYQTLRKEDPIKWLKDIRNHIRPKKIRYFGVGEYGGLNGRPHYHIVIYGWWPEDSKIAGARNGKNVFESEILNKMWGKGTVQFVGVTVADIMYTAGYESGKLSKTNKWPKDVIEPYLIKSQGLGRKYAEDNEEQIMGAGKCTLSGKDYTIPRYYWKHVYKIQKCNSLVAESVKDIQRKNSKPKHGTAFENHQRNVEEQRMKNNAKERFRKQMKGEPE